EAPPPSGLNLYVLAQLDAELAEARAASSGHVADAERAVFAKHGITTEAAQIAAQTRVAEVARDPVLGRDFRALRALAERRIARPAPPGAAAEGPSAAAPKPAPPSPPEPPIAAPMPKPVRPHRRTLPI